MDHRINQYHTFAELYDEWMSPSLYEQWEKYVRRRVPPHQKILDLGCGAGHLGVRLKSQGYEYTGLDISEEMLTLADAKQVTEAISFPLILGDMRDLSGLSTFDAIISFCDSLCYLENEKDLLQVFTEVYDHLSEEGVFLFDLHSIYQMDQFDGFSYHAMEEDKILLWDSFAGDFPHSCEHYLTILKRTSKDSYDRFNEVHYERTYPVQRVIELLNRANYTQIKVTAEFEQELSETSLRVFFEVRK